MPAEDIVYTVRKVADLEAALDDIASRRVRRNDVAALLHMSVCPMGLFSAFVVEATRLYFASQTRALAWPIDHEPAVFARAREVIESELATIRRESERTDGN